MLWVIVLLHHRSCLMLDITNILMHLWMHCLQRVQTLKQQSSIKPWCSIQHTLQLRRCFGVREHFPRSIAEHPYGFGQTWGIQQFSFFLKKLYLFLCASSGFLFVDPTQTSFLSNSRHTNTDFCSLRSFPVFYSYPKVFLTSFRISRWITLFVCMLLVKSDCVCLKLWLR